MSQGMKEWKIKYLQKKKIEKLKNMTTHRSRKKINFKENERQKRVYKTKEC